MYWAGDDTVLQPGEGSIRAARYLPVDPAMALWGRLPCADDAPVIELAPGDELTVDTLSHEGVLDDQGSDPVAFFGRHGVDPHEVLRDAVELAASRTRAPGVGPHVITGPIAVRGAAPGMLLAIDVVDAVPRVPYGVISNRHGRGALPDEYPVGGQTVSVFSRVVDGMGVVARRAGDEPDGFGEVPSARFPLAPFLGIMGVAVAGHERPDSVPPGAHGGNLDIKLLTAGSTLYLPVQVPGALAYVGDPHFAQGDGEVALTALEASLRATLRFRLVEAEHPLARVAREFGPIVETPAFLVPTGLDTDLGEANRKAVRAAIALLGAVFGMDAEHAYAYLSAATDFDISQVVDRVTGVHAKIRKADFA